MFVLEVDRIYEVDAATNESNDDKTNVFLQNCLQLQEQES
jgi:hypothetical protein